MKTAGYSNLAIYLLGQITTLDCLLEFWSVDSLMDEENVLIVKVHRITWMFLEDPFCKSSHIHMYTVSHTNWYTSVQTVFKV